MTKYLEWNNFFLAFFLNFNRKTITLSNLIHINFFRGEIEWSINSSSIETSSFYVDDAISIDLLYSNAFGSVIPPPPHIFAEFGYAVITLYDVQGGIIEEFSSNIGGTLNNLDIPVNVNFTTNKSFYYGNEDIIMDASASENIRTWRLSIQQTYSNGNSYPNSPIVYAEALCGSNWFFDTDLPLNLKDYFDFDYISYPLSNKPRSFNDVKYYFKVKLEAKDCSGTIHFQERIISINPFLFLAWGETSKVSESVLEPVFSLYPNPASNYLNLKGTEQLLEGEQVNIKLYDLQGRLMKSEIMYSNTLDISELTDGIYIAQVASENRLIHTEKIIVQGNGAGKGRTLEEE